MSKPSPWFRPKPPPPPPEWQGAEPVREWRDEIDYPDVQRELEPKSYWLRNLLRRWFRG